MVHGVLLINKTKGGTSHSVVAALRRIIGQKAVGHAGTLDPMAEGLILILLGYGTKLSDYLLMNDKRYRFVFRFGIVTDTLDKTGKIINQKKVQLEEKHIRQVLEKSLGKILLPVPIFSAVKIKGKKLYEYKRENQSVTPPLREMTFYDMTIKTIICHSHTDSNPEVEVELSCSKGSYIRSWVSFIGNEIGTGACLEELIRLHSTPFNLDKALTVKEVEGRLKGEKEINSEIIFKELSPSFIPFSKTLPHIEAICIAKQDEKQLRQGQIPKNMKVVLQDRQKEVNKSKKIQTIRTMSHNNEQMLALLKLQPFLSPKFLRVFPSGLS